MVHSPPRGGQGEARGALSAGAGDHRNHVIRTSAGAGAGIASIRQSSEVRPLPLAAFVDLAQQARGARDPAVDDPVVGGSELVDGYSPPPAKM